MARMQRVRVYKPNLASRIKNVFAPAQTVSWSELMNLVSGQKSKYAVTIDHPALIRCLSLGASVTAQLIQSPELRVQDRDGKTVSNKGTKRLIRIMTELPDGVLDAYNYWTRVSYDYLTFGNALQTVRRSGNNPSRLVRMLPDGFKVHDVKNGEGLVYELNYCATGNGATEIDEYPFTSVIHSMWPIPAGKGQYCGASPINLINRAIEIALKSDKYVDDFFEGGPTGALRSRTAITIPPNSSINEIKEFLENMEASANNRTPAILLDGMTLQNFKDDPADDELTKLREFQVREISRVYGFPAPLVGEQVTQWGSGIEELARLAWKFGFRQFVDAILNPLSARLLPWGQRFAINEVELLRGDTKALTDLIDKMLNHNAMRISEARNITGLPADMPPEHANIDPQNTPAKSLIPEPDNPDGMVPTTGRT